MGGYRSGNHKYDKKTLVTECWTVWVGQLAAWGQDHGRTLADLATGARFTLQWTARNGERRAQPLTLAAAVIGNGGRRYYLQCPACNRRALVLYLPYNAAAGQPYACRRCWRLIYPTQQQRFTALDRHMAAALAGAEPALSPRAARSFADTRRMRSMWAPDWLDRRHNVFDQGRE